MLNLGIELVERGLLPDALTGRAIRNLCRRRLAQERRQGNLERFGYDLDFAASMRSGPIAPVPEKANEQHYELPAEFFDLVLGPQKKYSCCYFADEGSTLAEAEEAALRQTCERAEIGDGQQILELGCGWGSLSLWMARNFPKSHITAVSNSASQRRFIDAKAAEQGIRNLTVITADMNHFTPQSSGISAGKFHRVVSVEMFEHMRNYRELLARIATWLRPEGKLFVHIFCHRLFTYPFVADGAANWMARYFFTGGIMPSSDLLRQFDRDLRVTKQWDWNGQHYQRTSQAWLANLDAHRIDAMDILSANYGRADARRWFHRWRMFFLACAELFGYASGSEWYVSHYLFQPCEKPLASDGSPV